MLRRIIPLLLLAALAGPASSQATRISPQGSCAIATLTSAVGITTANCVFASFTATLSTAGVLNVTAVASGTIIPGQVVVGTGVPTGTGNPRTASYITGQQSGTTGGIGVYTVANPPTTAVTSESMTTAGIPVNANYALICAYTQNVNYKPDGTAATATVGSGGQQITAGNCIGATTTFSKLSFFQQSATASLAIDFYAWQ